MRLTPNHAYRLGTAPNRVYRERCRSRWPEEEGVTALLSLVDEWLGLLAAFKCQELLQDVQQLKQAIAKEWSDQVARETHEKLTNRYNFLIGCGEDVPPPPPLHIVPWNGPGSFELARDLAEKADQTDIRQKLPADVHEAYDLGVLVGRCMGGEATDQDAMEVWTQLTRRGLQEWVTGKPAGTPFDVPIDRLILVRLEHLDELLSTQEWPPAQPETEPEPPGPYLTIQEAARLLKVGEDTVERLISSGQLKAAEISGKGKSAGRKIRRIRREAVDELMKATETSHEQSRSPRRRTRRNDSPKDYIG
jgi:excisionase family DNA binding protein